MSVAVVEWSAEYEIGHDKTDAQHQQLFKLLGLIDKAAKSDVNRTMLIEKSLNTLIDYTQVHFKDEETLMQKISYPQYEEHREQHDSLISSVENMLEEFESGEYVLIDELLLFLQDWLHDHILNHDAKIGVYIRQQQELLEPCAG